MIESELLLLKSKYFEEKVFENICLSINTKLSEVEFINCEFISCKFANSSFFDCRFENCIFRNCDLSSAKVKHSIFDCVIFEESKLSGIQWADTGIPLDVKYRQCTLNYCSFIGLNLKKAEMVDCKIHEADFTEANLSRADCRYSDFTGARFINTNLEYSDFTYASNYSIHPDCNKLKKTVFSMPDVLSLLNVYDIIIK